MSGRTRKCIGSVIQNKDNVSDVPLRDFFLIGETENKPIDIEPMTRLLVLFDPIAIKTTWPVVDYVLA